MAKSASYSPQTRRPSKIRSVAIAQMRVPPALVTQREFSQAQGDRLAADLDLNKLGFPIVNFRDGVHWLVDGQHRIYALKLNGFGEDVLECEVYENLTDKEMAEIFLGRDQRRPVSPFDKFHVACTAQYSRETAVRRAVETQGLRIGRNKEENTIGAIGSLLRVYDRAGNSHQGEVIVGKVCRTLKHAYGGDSSAFEAGMIEGIGLIFNRYNGRTDEKELSSRLAAHSNGVRGVIRRAETQRLRTGNLKAQCIASVVVEIYNRGLGPRANDRLPSWWKETEE